MIFITLQKSKEEGNIKFNINTISVINPTAGSHCNIHTTDGKVWKVEHLVEEINTKITSAKNQHYAQLHTQYYELGKRYGH